MNLSEMSASPRFSDVFQRRASGKEIGRDTFKASVAHSGSKNQNQLKGQVGIKAITKSVRLNIIPSEAFLSKGSNRLMLNLAMLTNSGR